MSTEHGEHDDRGRPVPGAYWVREVTDREARGKASAAFAVASVALGAALFAVALAVFVGATGRLPRIPALVWTPAVPDTPAALFD